MATSFGPRSFGASVVTLVIAVALVAETLSAFAGMIQRYLRVHYDARLEVGMVVGQVLFQWAFLARRSWDERFSYGWILLAVSGLGALLLLPIIALGPRLSFGSQELVIAFFAVVGVMFMVHWRLVLKYALPTWLCGTWVLYRLLLLLVLVRWR
jgi:hypothetical protein